MLLDPNTPPIGRQPASIKITPSAQAPSPWYGTVRGGANVAGSIQGGERFTLEQHNALIVRGKDIPTADSVTAFRQASDREMWWGVDQLPPVYAFECPVLEGLKDGSFKVIAPSGVTKIIQADGWVHRPYRRPNMGAFR